MNLFERCSRLFRRSPPAPSPVHLWSGLFPPPQSLACEVVIVRGAFDRWIIESGAQRSLAWSESRWVPHVQGLPAGEVQVSNFGDVPEVAAYLRDFPYLAVVAVIDVCSITCLRCSMTSYWDKDVSNRYCGNCHRFHGSTAVEGSC
jgi:hypothetical protein